MTIAIGQPVPHADIVKVTPEGPEKVDAATYFAGRKVVLFAVPGAFTPTCSARHLPGYVERLSAFEQAGVAEVGCTSVNDFFVMNAWAQASGADGITMLADGNAALARALGLEMDGSAFGMGTRSQRYAMVIDNGVVTKLFVEAPGEFRVSAAEHVLQNL